MGDALASALAMMEPQLRQRQVTIERTLPEQPVQVMGDRVRIEQVMINLLRNAHSMRPRRWMIPKVEIILAAGETASH